MVSEENIFEIVDDGRTTDDGRTPEHGYTISSPVSTLEPEILYLAYLELELTSSAIVGLNAFLASPYLP